MLMKEYDNLGKTISRYFSAYGGWNALLRSPYFHVAIGLTLVLYPLWSQPGWWDIPLSILPNLLGFSLGGYAILLSFGDEKFRSLVTGSNSNKPSPYLGTSGTFAHFIIVQAIAIVISLIAKARLLSFASSLWEDLAGSSVPASALRSAIIQIIWGCGFCVFSYAMLLTIAAALGVFTLSSWYDRIPHSK